MSWGVVGFGKHKTKTLPQILFSDPDWFFWAIKNGAFNNRPALLSEAEDLHWKATHVKVPELGKATLAVEHFVDPLTMKYSHFMLVDEGQVGHQGSSPAIRATVIDMSMPTRIAKYDKTGCRNLIASLKTVCFGDKAARMTKQKCESFFDEDGNFQF